MCRDLKGEVSLLAPPAGSNQKKNMKPPHTSPLKSLTTVTGLKDETYGL